MCTISVFIVPVSVCSLLSVTVLIAAWWSTSLVTSSVCTNFLPVALGPVRDTTTPPHPQKNGPTHALDGLSQGTASQAVLSEAIASTLGWISVRRFGACGDTLFRFVRPSRLSPRFTQRAAPPPSVFMYSPIFLCICTMGLVKTF